MKAVAAVWDFIAGESRVTPAAVVAAVAVAVLLVRGHADATAAALAYAGIIAAGLVGAAFERV